MNRGVRKAFTLVELLVVITIIGMLMALLLPAIQAARESGRRVTCLDHLRNVAVALLNRESSRREFPGYWEVYGRAGTGDDSEELTTSWVPPILRELERSDLAEIYRDPSYDVNEKPGSPGNPSMLSVLQCPSEPKTGRSPLGYVVNCGIPDREISDENRTPDRKFNGVFHNHHRDLSRDQKVKVSLDYISGKDGSQNTLMVAESIHAGPWGANDSGVPQPEQFLGFLWTYAEDADQLDLFSPVGTNPLDPTNPDASDVNPDPGTMSSAHGGGVNVAFCSGSQTWLNEDIHYRVYQHLMTPDGRAARAWAMGDPENADECNLFGVLDEGDF